jgi:hypothetical protein
MRLVHCGWTAALLVAAGCADGPATGDVSGTVTINGQPPPPGASITFIPADGSSPTAGATIENGRYAAKVPVGRNKVQIRAPRATAKKAAGQGGYTADGEIVEESLPDKYHDKTELTLDVVAGTTVKDWELSTK